MLFIIFSLIISFRKGENIGKYKNGASLEKNMDTELRQGDKQRNEGMRQDQNVHPRDRQQDYQQGQQESNELLFNLIRDNPIDGLYQNPGFSQMDDNQRNDANRQDKNNQDASQITDIYEQTIHLIYQYFGQKVPLNFIFNEIHKTAGNLDVAVHRIANYSPAIHHEEICDFTYKRIYAPKDQIERYFNY